MRNKIIKLIEDILLNLKLEITLKQMEIENKSYREKYLEQVKYNIELVDKIKSLQSKKDE